MLASLIAGFVSGETLLALRRARNATIAYVLAAICGLFGIIFLLVAAYIAAASRLGPIPAALWAAGIFLVVGLLVLLIHRLSSVQRVKRATRARNSDLSKIAIAAGLAILPSLLKGRAGKATLIAPAVAAIAYAIYKENARSRPTKRDGD